MITIWSVKSLANSCLLPDARPQFQGVKADLGGSACPVIDHLVSLYMRIAARFVSIGKVSIRADSPFA